MQVYGNLHVKKIGTRGQVKKATITFEVDADTP